MMSAAVICDRCGKVVKRDDAVRIDYLYVVRRAGNVAPIRGGDLCLECDKEAKYENAGMEIMATVPAKEAAGKGETE